MGFEAIVEAAAGHIGVTPSVAVLVWRVLSGMTHGDMWASSNMVEAERLAESADGEAALTALHEGAGNETIVRHAREAEKLGIDCPLGWPVQFVEFISSHVTGKSSFRQESRRNGVERWHGE